MFDQSRKHDKDQLLNVLTAAGAEIFSEKKIRCPWHSDGDASETVYETPDGAWLYHCFPCDFCGDIYAVEKRAGVANGKSYVRKLPETETKPMISYPTIEAARATLSDVEKEYRYTNPETKQIDYVAFRIQPPRDRKRFMPMTKSAAGWQFTDKNLDQLPLYNRARIATAIRVIVVEGEKCVHALTALQFVATTSPGGSAAAKKANWTLLERKKVYLWADNDDPGRKYIADVRQILEQLENPPELFMIQIETLNLPKGGDAVDYLESNGGEDADKKAAVELLMVTAEPLDELAKHVQYLCSGQFNSVDWPWPCLTRLTEALYPGTITVMCGTAGASKSLMLGQALLWWLDRKIKVAFYELEETKKYYQMRALAQLAGDRRVMLPKWCELNPEDFMALYANWESQLKKIGDCYRVNQIAKMTELSDWVEHMAKAGRRLLVIDPVTAGLKSRDTWLDDQEFILRAHQSLEKYGASLIAVTHPAKAKQSKAPTMDDMAGGASWQRFTQTVLWLKYLTEEEKVVVYGSALAREHRDINRRMIVCKARNAGGAHVEIGYWFDSDSLRMIEQGAIIEKKGRK